MQKLDSIWDCTTGFPIPPSTASVLSTFLTRLYISSMKKTGSHLPSHLIHTCDLPLSPLYMQPKKMQIVPWGKTCNTMVRDDGPCFFQIITCKTTEEIVSLIGPVGSLPLVLCVWVYNFVVCSFLVCLEVSVLCLSMYGCLP